MPTYRTQNPVPHDLEERLTEALCVGPLSEIKERLGNMVQDFAAQKVATAYLRYIPADPKTEAERLSCIMVSECLGYLCDQFGLKKPGP